MSQTNVNIRMDETLKQQFDHLCNELGLNMSTAINIFAKTMVRQQKIPFEVSLDPFYSESNMAHLRRGIKALNSGKGVEHDIIEVEDKRKKYGLMKPGMIISTGNSRTKKH